MTQTIVDTAVIVIAIITFARIAKTITLTVTHASTKTVPFARIAITPQTFKRAHVSPDMQTPRMVSAITAIRSIVIVITLSFAKKNLHLVNFRDVKRVIVIVVTCRTIARIAPAVFTSAEHAETKTI
jgi:hypothetical protein